MQNLEIGSSTIHRILDKFSDEIKRKRLLKKVWNVYQMKNYKISSGSTEHLVLIYTELEEKYHCGELKQIRNSWYKTERKLFSWFLICYCDDSKKNIFQLTEAEWNMMSHLFFNKNPMLLKFQGFSLLKSTKRHRWTVEDDVLLKRNVEDFGSREWNEVSKSIFFQREKCIFISPKQCRERWYNHISQEINKNVWSPEEDVQILKMFLSIGNKWSHIAREIGTHRTEHMIKNRFNSLVNRSKTKKRINVINLAKKSLVLLGAQDLLDNRQRRELMNGKQIHPEKQKRSLEILRRNVKCQTKNIVSYHSPKIEAKQQLGPTFRSEQSNVSNRKTEPLQGSSNLAPSPNEIGLANIYYNKNRQFIIDQSQPQSVYFSMPVNPVVGLSPSLSGNSFFSCMGNFIMFEDTETIVNPSLISPQAINPTLLSPTLVNPAQQCFSPCPTYFSNYNPTLPSIFSNLPETNGRMISEGGMGCKLMLGVLDSRQDN